MAQNVELTSEILQVNTISVDPLTLLNPGSKTMFTATANSNTIQFLTTKMAGTVSTFSSGAVTQNQSGVGGVFSLTLNNTNIAASDQVFATVGYTVGALAQTGGNPTIGAIQPSAGSVTISVVNTATTAGTCFCGYLQISYVIFKN